MVRLITGRRAIPDIACINVYEKQIYKQDTGIKKIAFISAQIPAAICRHLKLYNGYKQ